MRMNLAAIYGLIGVGGLDSASIRETRVPASLRAFRRGKTKISESIYIPGGPSANVAGTPVKNPKIATQMQSMHERWYAKRFA